MTAVNAPRTPLDLRARTGGTVTFRLDELGGRRVMVVEVGGENRGALRSEDGENLAVAARTARQLRVPLVCFVASSGADLSEGVAAIHGWGTAAREFVACSGVIPMVFCVDGLAVSGPALLLGLADLVVMVEETYAFVSGPQMVQRFTGEELSNEGLGGASMHTRTSGVAHFTVADRDEAVELVTELLNFLPDHADSLPAPVPCVDPVNRPTPEAGDLLPDTATGSYDVRHVIECIVDDGHLLEPRAAFATNLVTAFATIGGRPVGIVANQPQSVAGTLDIPSSQKGGRFVAFCDAFNLPLITFVDTSGFYPGKDLEWRGMIRYGAQMAFAYARATVPRVCVILRKSYGGAYIVMDSRYIGNDLMLAWPSAEIAVMGAKGAIEILHREASEEERVALVAAYEERFLNPYVAAERGSVDQVIEPADTRGALVNALDALIGKREHLPRRRHDNTPL
ncbi:MAG TPA: carboxyl transferase domain-containing protein [Acidimicrobiales bacterium]|nr:methylmalonyl-CoA carboxyltransferase [Actinomycetes bacterium]MDP6106514.1 carboxyl transferase domain-containing protein [Acidimicrobiales bacterium]MDP6240962.1 carboxyl transferase domain-containing protein [Acidimicrobiales bacterium]MDP7125103.1 carboxyl transferase domain-containing protein [Acidimicrobiales bacterium]MDP7351991.1 carboxyl transferase domain-containing protein [Acidimicrobiales bacterium]